MCDFSVILILKGIMTVLSQNCDELEIAEEKGGHFLYSLFVRGKFFKHLWFILMYSV